MPDDDPLENHPEMHPERYAPPVCDRYPTCEGYLDVSHPLDPYWEYPGDCTWPDCSTPPTKGAPTP
jgi:hypothetical protein